MPKSPKRTSRTFRLQPEVLEEIARLSEDWEVSQARVIELLVRDAAAEGKTLQSQLVPGGQSPSAGADRERATGG